MKKFLLVLLFALCLICKVTAVEPRHDTLSKIENKILGIEYPDQKIEKRVERLEEYLYGNKKQGNPKTRLTKIIETTKYSLLEDDNTVAQNNYENNTYIEPLDDSVDYPVLDDVEKRLGLNIKQKEPLNSRLASIEKKIFNKTHDTDDYFSRVERIKSKVYKDNELAHNKNFEKEEDFLKFGSSNESFFNKGAQTISYKITLLEQRLLKTTFQDETNNDRLTRLENAIFETQFYNEDENERINRLESALIAQKSSQKYDNNKFQQGVNTAMQIGAMVLMVLAFIL